MLWLSDFAETLHNFHTNSTPVIHQGQKQRRAQHWNLPVDCFKYLCKYYIFHLKQWVANEHQAGWFKGLLRNSWAPFYMFWMIEEFFSGHYSRWHLNTQKNNTIYRKITPVSGNHGLQSAWCVLASRSLIGSGLTNHLGVERTWYGVRE